MVILSCRDGPTWDSRSSFSPPRQKKVWWRKLELHQMCMKCRNHVNPKSSWHQQRQIDFFIWGDYVTNLKVGMALTYNIMKILFLKPYEWNVHRDKIKTLMRSGVKQIVTLVCGTRIWNTSLVRKGCPNILWSKTSSFSIVRLLRVPNTYNSIWMGKL